MSSVKHRVLDNGTTETIYKTVVYKFLVSDVDDPSEYAAQSLREWHNSAAGSFVMEHAIGKPICHSHADILSMNYEYIVVANLEKKKLAEFYLKWGKI